MSDEEVRRRVVIVGYVMVAALVLLAIRVWMLAA